ncbi:carboxypeptidase-like regulatory domain-containing protein [Spirosoma sp. RP8]|uniref:Carboxypeptidase-like regulatory domain-containing protein n=1 Tax=Spirosoma liriopis TaxID=2937440 RepID=A0ABT0HKC8_9BACT|nr:carboxypeptidase-like regulatory domain-containing protein [Spirosoma liriopis]MCK8492445.1 carboxypeptidase-like regulatory domain-containing protein [Spirosoma liriopis]
MKLPLVFSILLLGLCLSGCIHSNRSTTIHGKVTDDSNQPIANVPIIIAGLRKGTLYHFDKLEAVYTNRQGEYTITFVPSNQYRSLEVANQFNTDSTLYHTYRDYSVTFNNQSKGDCCAAQIGYTSQYDFILLAR